MIQTQPHATGDGRGSDLSSLGFFLWCLLIFSPVLVFLLPIGFVVLSRPCMTETLHERTNVSGYDFLITETDCDTLVRNSTISVFISNAGSSKRELLFKYFPNYHIVKGQDTAIIPTLYFEAPANLVIKISEISSLHTQLDAWNSLSIRYDIRKVDYPK